MSTNKHHRGHQVIAAAVPILPLRSVGPPGEEDRLCIQGNLQGNFIVLSALETRNCLPNFHAPSCFETETSQHVNISRSVALARPY